MVCAAPISNGVFLLQVTVAPFFLVQHDAKAQARVYQTYLKLKREVFNAAVTKEVR